MDVEKARAILDFICYNCGEKGHKAKDCRSPPQPKAHLRAAHTENPNRSDDGNEPSEDKGRATPDASEVGDQENINEEIVEFEVPDNTYSNDFYERKSTSDFLASM